MPDYRAGGDRREGGVNLIRALARNCGIVSVLQAWSANKPVCRPDQPFRLDLTLLI